MEGTEHVAINMTEEWKGPTTQAFYDVNKAQHFDFPHANCDEHTDQELATLYFKQSGFGEFCRRTVSQCMDTPCDMATWNALQHNAQFVNYVVAWLRLKYVAEIVDPVRYARYFSFRPRPLPNKPLRLPAELLELYDVDMTELFTFVDQLANKIQFRWIEMILGWDGSGRSHLLDDECTRLNAELQTIRSRVVPPYALNGVDPYELALYPFLAYHLELRRVLLDLPPPA